jgi:hypothetical protein
VNHTRRTTTMTMTMTTTMTTATTTRATLPHVHCLLLRRRRVVRCRRAVEHDVGVADCSEDSRLHTTVAAAAAPRRSHRTRDEDGDARRRTLFVTSSFSKRTPRGSRRSTTSSTTTSQPAQHTQHARVQRERERASRARPTSLHHTRCTYDRRRALRRGACREIQSRRRRCSDAAAVQHHGQQE